MTKTRLSGAHRFVTRFVNPVTMKIAGWAPGFGIITYKGRKTGRTYRSPVNVFRRGNSYLFVLTYGSAAQWIQNVLAAGGCRLEMRGTTHSLVEPKLVVDPTLEPAPLFVRLVGRLFAVTEYVWMTEA